MNKWDRQHIRDIQRLEKLIESLFVAAATDASQLVAIIGTLGDKPFSWTDYPLAHAKMKAIIKQLNGKVHTAIVNGVRSQWTLSNNKNNELCRNVFGSLIGSLPESYARRYFSTNEAARDAFVVRKVNGLALSDNVWNYTNQFKNEIEMALDLGVRTGKSADALSRDVRDYLKHPNKLFRRVRDEHGQLHLSRNAAAFHPGQGVYRSSYMNARRLAATETNIAYRTADHLRWQQMDFVVGIEIHLSNNHNCKGVPAGAYYDICDELKGKYPKDFQFTGWHPHCRCYATSILKTEDEMMEDNLRILAGEDVSENSENAVTKLPDNFTAWVEKNQERIARAKSMPYFLRDNEALIDASAAPVPQPVPRKSATEIAAERHSARTLAEQRKIQDAWDARKYGQEYVNGMHELEKSLGVERGLRMSFEEADRQNANPNYGQGKEYGINCQTCAPAFALRLAGFDVTAKGNTSGSLLETLSRQQSLYAWNNPDGSVAQYTNLHTWMMSKGYKAMNQSRYLEFWNESTTEAGVYIFTINWKGGGAHTSVLMRLADGTLRYVEPQKDNSSKPIDKELQELANSGSSKPKGVRGIIRVDDKVFNSKWAGIFNARNRRK